MDERLEGDLGAERGAGARSPAAGAVVELKLRLEEFGEAYGGLRLVNPRAEKQMRDSLQRYGQMSPVVVCRAACGGHELVDGFKRLRSARRLSDLHTLRARVLDVGARAAKAAVLCLNWISRSVIDLEEGWVVHALCRQDGLTQAEAGRLLGRDQSWISRRLSLVERLTDEVQSQLRLGLISGAVGRELARVPRGAQQRVLEAVTRHGLGSRDVSSLVQLHAESNPEQRERLLSSPRAALARRDQGSGVPKDQRLGEAGNRLLGQLCRMQQACVRVSHAVDLRGMSRLDESEMLVLAPSLGRAQRAGHQATQALDKALAATTGSQ